LKKILILSIGLAIWLSFVGLELTEASCEAETSGWTLAYEALEKAMESYRLLKGESVAPRIEAELEKMERRRSIARSVYEVLKERARLLGDAKTKCLELAQSERSVYDEWRRCAGNGGDRRRNPDPHGPNSVARQRSGLLATLQDLLLDEAYVQYKNYRDPSHASYSFDQTPYMGGQNSSRTQRQTGPYPNQGYFR
jgi:hypothetical protein